MRAAEESEEIRKISIGVIKNSGRAGSPLRITAKSLPQKVHGLCVQISKGALHQTFRMYLASEASLVDWSTRFTDFGAKDSGKRGKQVRNTRSQRKDWS